MAPELHQPAEQGKDPKVARGAASEAEDTSTAVLLSLSMRLRCQVSDAEVACFRRQRLTGGVDRLPYQLLSAA